MSEPDHTIELQSERYVERFMLTGGKVIDVTYELPPHDGQRREAVLQTAAKLWGKGDWKIVGSTRLEHVEHQAELDL